MLGTGDGTIDRGETMQAVGSGERGEEVCDRARPT